MSSRWRQCSECLESFYSTRPRKTCSDKCAAMRQRKYWAAYGPQYRRTEAYETSQRKYRSSDKGRATRNRISRRIKKTDKAKAKRREYRRLPHVQEAEAAYRKSPSRKAAEHRYNTSPKGRSTRHGILLNYRAKLSEGPPFDAAAWNAKLRTLGGRCQNCGSPDRIEIDHIIPVSRGGTNHIDNLQPLCRPCNASKGNRLA